MEKHEKKLKKLKTDFLKELKSEAVLSCAHYRIQYSKCCGESLFNRCNKYMKSFVECAENRYKELLEENKEILEFKIDPDE